MRLTSVQSLLEVNRGLMVVPKPTMLSMVPEGRLFSATTMASCGKKQKVIDRMGSFQCMHLNLKTAVQWLFLSIPPLRD